MMGKWSPLAVSYREDSSSALVQPGRCGRKAPCRLIMTAASPSNHVLDVSVQRTKAATEEAQGFEKGFTLIIQNSLNLGDKVILLLLLLI